ncbi:hypothetical protein SUGI_0045880 [Cryptomeria japonica]|nr:hypothetical protein SUGI_0045880 [Cryptomeria japonica]
MRLQCFLLNEGPAAACSPAILSGLHFTEACFSLFYCNWSALFGSSELFFPRVILHVIYVLGFMKSAVSCLVRCVGFGGFEPGTSSVPEQADRAEVMTAERIRARLPVVTLGALAEKDIMCAVCLHDLNGEEEIRRLNNCRHIFHRGCLDKWLDYEHTTCPLCRSPFLC